MRGSEKSKRVSWAPDVNLCQVRLFLSDESPSQVGLGTQDYLQAKSSMVSQSTGAGFDDNLPPGFEGAHPSDLLKNKLSQVPLPKWRCPLRFVLDLTWQVVAGEESKEKEMQNQREMRILEAVYPRPSAIPPNPSGLTDFEYSPHNNLNIPLIPITPIEDEDATIGEASTYNTPQNAIPTMSLPAQCTNPTANGNTGLGPSPGAGTDMVAQAAYAVLNAVATSNNQGSLISPDLLMKVLNDPKWRESLMAANHGTTMNWDPMSNPSLPSVLPPDPLLVPPLNGPFYSPNRVGTSSPPTAAKDLSYYKSLIQQHGGERLEGVVPQPNNRQNLNQEPMNNANPKDSKSKKAKPCIYFNSSRGCRNGASCPYQHDASCSVQSSKRVKLDREITGEQS